MRVMALDVGERRIGVAVCDPLGITAQGVETYTRKGEVRDEAHFDELLQTWQVERLVVGLPRHMNGDEGDSAQKARAFGDALSARYGLPVTYVDERLTTVAAHRALSEGNANHKKRKNAVDMLAAVMILQSYLQGLAAGREVE